MYALVNYRHLLVQIVAYRLFDTELSAEPMMAYYQLQSWGRIWGKFESHNTFIQQSGFKSIYEMVAISSTTQWVNQL